MRISDWSSDVCSSDLLELVARDHIVELAPAEEDRLVEQAVVRQVDVLPREAADDHDEAAIGPRIAEQKTGCHRGAVAETASPRPLAAGIFSDPHAALRRLARQAGGTGNADHCCLTPIGKAHGRARAI